MEIRKHFYNYIEEHNLHEDLDSKLQKIGYVNFFNDLTTVCLGEPNFTHEKYNQTSSSLVYLSEEAKEKLLSDLDVIYVSRLYYGIKLNGQMKFNYPNFTEFLEALVMERVKLKKEACKQNQSMIQLIKIYMNLVYGMLDNPESILTCEMDNPREYIAKTAKIIMATIAQFFINKSKPIYYIDTDEMFVPHLTDEEFGNLKKFFVEKCGSLINTTISNIFIEPHEKSAHAIIFTKKRYILTDRVRAQGLKRADDNKILLENKKYFGKHFREIFPEYII